MDPRNLGLGGLRVANVIKQRDGALVDLDEFQANVSGDWIGFRRPGDFPHRHDRVVADVEGHPQDITEVDLAADGFKTNAARREIPADSQQIPSFHRCKGNHLIGTDSIVFPPFVSCDFLHGSGRPLGNA
jgi:hypothetical protein